MSNKTTTLFKSKFKIEYKTGNVKITKSNTLISDIEDMDALEFWEQRLTSLSQPYVVAYRKIFNKVKYSIFTDMRAKESVFK